jgi:hypothetical protein
MAVIVLPVAPAMRESLVQKTAETPMRTTLLFTVASITISSITMIAQQAGVNPGASAESTPSSSMNADKAEPKNSVSGELKNKLDAKTARVGETVVLKIDQKVTTVDGTVIPKGSRPGT